MTDDQNKSKALEGPSGTIPHIMKYLVVELVKDNSLKIIAQSDNLSIAASEHMRNNKPGMATTFLLKPVKYSYNVEEVQSE